MPAAGIDFLGGAKIIYFQRMRFVIVIISRTVEFFLHPNTAIVPTPLTLGFQLVGAVFYPAPAFPGRSARTEHVETVVRTMPLVQYDLFILPHVGFHIAITEIIIPIPPEIIDIAFLSIKRVEIGHAEMGAADAVGLIPLRVIFRRLPEVVQHLLNFFGTARGVVGNLRGAIVVIFSVSGIGFQPEIARGMNPNSLFAALIFQLDIIVRQKIKDIGLPRGAHGSGFRTPAGLDK